MARGKARAFGQDLANDTVRDQHFYAKKRATERAIGRDLTIDEFRASYYVPDDAPTAMGTSIFDPVLCELAYRWFCPPGGAVLDPFAGGSVRGVVAGVLGRPYVGIDLRPEQCVANRIQAEFIGEGRDGWAAPMWVAGDSIEVLAGETEAPPLTSDWLNPEGRFDFVFSCPPYADLEVYSDDPRDLSTMDYPAFLAAYRVIIRNTVARLKPDRFACFVVGDVRGPDGAYRSFPQHTIEAFEAAGCRLYNDAILVTAAGSLPIRAGRQFAASRKLGTTHQRVLVFVKGDGRAAADAVGPVEFGDIETGEDGDPGPVSDEESDDPFAGETFGPGQLTPIHQAEDGGGPLWLKRDDLFAVAGVQGGKVRTCWALAQAATQGLVTAGSTASPQVNIVAQIGRHLGRPVRAHTPSGKLGPEVEAAQAAGAHIVQHKPGYNTVIVARARADAAELGWTEIPFGMECEEAVRQTASQVRDIPPAVRRIVVPVGSGMSLAGILHGLAEHGPDIPVLGVIVGADPIKRLDRYAPPAWRDMCTLVPAGVKYEQHVEGVRIGGVLLDPVYEAKCAPFLEAGDLLWIVGVRATL